MNKFLRYILEPYTEYDSIVSEEDIEKNITEEKDLAAFFDDEKKVVFLNEKMGKNKESLPGLLMIFQDNSKFQMEFEFLTFVFDDECCVMVNLDGLNGVDNEEFEVFTHCYANNKYGFRHIVMLKYGENNVKKEHDKKMKKVIDFLIEDPEYKLKMLLRS